MPKSLAAQLQAALDAGDIEKAKQLAAKLGPPKKPKAPKPKAAGKAPTKPARASAAKKAPEPVDTTGEPPRLVLPPGYGTPQPGGVVSLAEYRPQARAGLAPLGPGEFRMPEGQGRGTRVDKNGRVRREGRRESMALDPPKVVPLKDSGRGGIAPQFAKVDEKNGRAGDADAAYRPPVRKVQAPCVGCHRPFIVWESDLAYRHDDDMSGEWFYRCARCCKKGI